MAVKVGINGFGRIGRQVFKAIYEQHEGSLEIVGINDLSDNNTLAHMLRYDSTYGIWDADISADEHAIYVDDNEIKAFAERDPADLKWGELGVDIVLECTGFFTDGEKAKAHMQGGAKKVIISAPGTNVDGTFVLGVNDDQYDPDTHHVVSNASCTTNCLAPVAKVLHEHFGIQHAIMTTVHSYTGDQMLLDGTTHKDLRRARSAAINIVPTTTGAARAVALVLPELKGKFDGFALRVPTPTVSLVDLTVDFDSDVTAESINKAFEAEANGALEGILDYTDEPLVSTDFRADPHSAIVDGLSTLVIGERMGKVIAWYDNEWGYSCRLGDLTLMMANAGIK